MAVIVRATANKYTFVNSYSFYNKSTIMNKCQKNLLTISYHSFSLQQNYENVLIFKGFSKISSSSNFSNILKRVHYGTYDNLMASRRSEAERSIIVQVQSAQSFEDLYHYCYQFGNIKNVYHYDIGDNTPNFFIVEFGTIDGLQRAISHAIYKNDKNIIPVQSRILWFRNSLEKKKWKALEQIPERIKKNLNSMNNSSNETIANAVSSVNSFSKQMEILYGLLKLDESEIRLRYLTAFQIESAFSSLFRYIKVLPFGSSVNGFGKRGCDLDVVLNFRVNQIQDNNRRLVFHTNMAPLDERLHMQSSMEIIASAIKYFVPGIKNVRKILNARVPIIKYDHKFTGLECDLSMTNMTAVYMSELLYLYGEIHGCIRPLVFTIKHWASCVGLTQSSPGYAITNFSLSLLVIFFLQSKKIVPSIKQLQCNADISDVRLAETSIDCTFIRDITKWPVTNNKNIGSLETLLAEFYHFYANFNYTAHAISLREGNVIHKSDSSSLYICNPLDPTLNVSKNVNGAELSKFVNYARNAANIMDNSRSFNNYGLHRLFDQNDDRTEGKKSRKISILNLFKSKNNTSTKKRLGRLETQQENFIKSPI